MLMREQKTQDLKLRDEIIKKYLKSCDVLDRPIAIECEPKKIVEVDNFNEVQKGVHLEH